jgi:hypothetical protein
MKQVAVLLVVFFAGCGSGGGSNNNPAPTTHLLDQSAVRDIPTGQTVTVGPLTVPAGATITYQIVDMPTGIGGDTMDTGIVTDATAQAANPTTFAYQTDVSSTEGMTTSLVAGTYDLLVACHNLLDDCDFTDTVTAFY